MSDDVWIDLTVLAAPRHDDDPRPRLEAHGDYVFGVVVLPLFVPEDVRVIYQEIDLLATRDRLVTVCKTPPGGAAYSVAAVRAGIRLGPRLPVVVVPHRDHDHRADHLLPA